MARKNSLIHIHSNVYSDGTPKTPSAENLNLGEIAINYNATEPCIFIKDQEENIIKFNAIQKSQIEFLSNKITGLTSGSTDTQYPSAKAVYDKIDNIHYVSYESGQTLTSEQKQNVLSALGMADETLNLTLSCTNPSSIIGAVITIVYNDTSHQYEWSGNTLQVIIPMFSEYTISFSNVAGYYRPETLTFISRKNGIRNVTVYYDDAQYTDLSMKDINGNDLSSRETANCYVIKSSGYYEIPLVYGCAIQSGITNANSYTQIEGTYTQPFYNYNNAQIQSPFIETDTGNEAVSGETLYVDVTGFTIEGIYLVQRNLCKYIRFQVTSFPSLGGNAMIAIKDGSGQVMWSWHLWAYQDTISTKVHVNTNNVTYNFMDVNLGWVKESSDSKHGTCPYYQWGRKDPMLKSGIASPSVGSWRITTCATSVGSTIQNPNAFNKNIEDSGETNYNWWTDNGEAVNFYNYWDASQTTVGCADKTVIKTIYDPCPVGFSIPCGNAFLGFSINNGGVWESGWTWDDRFFRACGGRDRASGGVSSVGSSGYCWVSASNSQMDAHRLYFYSSNVYPQYASYRAHGFSVCPVLVSQ